MKTSDTLKEITPALLKAQAKIEGVVKSNTADTGKFRYNYADLTSVIEAIKKPLNENGLILIQPVNGDAVETRVIHTSGEWIADDGVKVVSARPDDPQAQGSAITYARRYGLMSLLAIPAEDDDGEKAMVREPVRPAQSTLPTPPPPPTETLPTEMCPVHNLPMKQRTTATGGHFFSHAQKTPTGEWEYCSGAGWGVK